VEVRFSDTQSSLMVLPEIDTSAMSPPEITVPNFSSLASMIKGTERITTQLAVMQLGLLHELDTAPLPVKTQPLTLYLIWHRREHDDPAHRWMRGRIIETVKAIIN
jgi:DNA-binding transcriptional LysR family regulator